MHTTSEPILSLSVSKNEGFLQTLGIEPNGCEIFFFINNAKYYFLIIFSELKKWTTSITDLSLRKAQNAMQQDCQILFQTQININVLVPPSQNEVRTWHNSKVALL